MCESVDEGRARGRWEDIIGYPCALFTPKSSKITSLQNPVYEFRTSLPDLVLLYPLVEFIMSYGQKTPEILVHSCRWMAALALERPSFKDFLIGQPGTTLVHSSLVQQLALMLQEVKPSPGTKDLPLVL